MTEATEGCQTRPAQFFAGQLLSVTAVTAEAVKPSYTRTINREGTQMTIHFHHTSRIATALFGAASRRRFSMPSGMDRRFFADIGFSQTDIIALHTR